VKAADSRSSPTLSPPASLQQQFFDSSATGNPRGGGQHQGHPTVTIRYPSTFSASPNTLRPLYVFLHPYESTASALTFQTDYGFGTVEDDQNALSIAPLGTMDVSNDRYWNASGGCCDLDASAPNDVTYLATLIQQIIDAGWPVDRSRIYLIGASNGGFMASRLAAERPDLVTAVWMSAGGAASTAAIGGSDSTYSLTYGGIGYHVAIVESHGTSDGTISYTGGTFSTMPKPYPSVEGSGGTSTAPTTGGTVRQWLDANGCSSTMTSQGTADYDTAVVGSESTIYDADSCPTGGAIRHIKMTGSAHSPTYNATIRSMVIAWLEAHHR